MPSSSFGVASPVDALEVDGRAPVRVAAIRPISAASTWDVGYTTLGSTGMEVSEICLGCTSFGTGSGFTRVPLS